MSALVTSAIIAGASGLAAAGGSSIAASKMNARAEKYNRWALKEQQRYQKAESHRKQNHHEQPVYHKKESRKCNTPRGSRSYF